MAQARPLHGFHAVAARLRHAPATIRELYVDRARRDARMRSLVARAEDAGVKILYVDGERLDRMAHGAPHQGVVALTDALSMPTSLDDVLDAVPPDAMPLVLVLDGVTDPHNLGACLRVADGAGAHAVVAPKDRAAGLNATATKVASGAAETVPYVTVTNLARTLRELKERDLVVVGTSDDAASTIHALDLDRPVAWVLGAEGEGMRRLTRDTCDVLARIPMQGAVESLNVSVASGVCLYETLRQRSVAKESR